MTPYAAAIITKDRLRLWQRRNEREGLPCTPAVLINVCHEPDKLGQIVLNTTDDMPLHFIHAALVQAADEVAQQLKRRN